MAFEQKPPNQFFDSKNPQPPLDLERMFKEERINMKAILDSRKLTKEINKTLAPYTGEFGDAQKKHLLKRTMVGYASRHLKDLEGMTMDEAVDRIMTPHDPGEPINNYYHEISEEEYLEKYGNSDVSPREPFISKEYVKDANTGNDEISGNERNSAIMSWLYHSMYSQPTSICWKFFVFLHNLTPVIQLGRHKIIYAYLRLIFEGPFRSYKDFIYDLTIDPSMLEYLNLMLSRKETPDENYAREVQELFTVGKRPFAQFTEDDVHEAARLLVGWSYNFDKTNFSEGWKPHPRFDPNNHDTGDKQFSSFYNNTLIKGREGEEGAQELDEFIDMIFETDEVAIYLSRRLFQFFVYPVLTDHAEENIIKPLADVMRANNYNLAETLKVLLKSEYFYSDELFNSLIKAPLDFTMGLHKEFDILNGDLIAWDNELNKVFNSIHEDERSYFDEKYFDINFRVFRLFGNHFRGHYENQGMSILNPPSVSGWKPFYQEPVYDLIWLNSMTIKRKVEITRSLSEWGDYLFNNVNIKYNLTSFMDSFANASDINAFTSEITDRFLGAPIPLESFERIKKNVLGDELNEWYWTQAVVNFKNNPSKENYNNLNNRIRRFLSQVFQLNEIYIH